MEWRESRQVQRVQAAILCTNKRARSHRGMLGSRLWTARPSLSYTLLLVELTAQKLQKLLSMLLYWALDNFMIINSRHTSVP